MTSEMMKQLDYDDGGRSSLRLVSLCAALKAECLPRASETWAGV